MFREISPQWLGFEPHPPHQLTNPPRARRLWRLGIQPINPIQSLRFESLHSFPPGSMTIINRHKSPLQLRIIGVWLGYFSLALCLGFLSRILARSLPPIWGASIMVILESPSIVGVSWSSSRDRDSVESDTSKRASKPAFLQ